MIWITCLALAVSVAPRAGEAKSMFNGNDLDGWRVSGDKAKNQWRTGAAALDDNDASRFRVWKSEAGKGDLVNAAGGGVNLVTDAKFGDCTLDIEFMVPKGSNSGVYLMGEYEVQVFDSFGKEKLGPGDLGAIYGVAVPKVNVSRQPGEWQAFHIEFVAPRFDGDKKTANAKFVKVALNGTTLHENVEVTKPTTAALTGKESATGPLMLQGDHGPVAYRNIKLTAK